MIINIYPHLPVFRSPFFLASQFFLSTSFFCLRNFFFPSSVCMLSHLSCVQLLWLCCSPTGSSVHQVLQTRILEWVTMSFSRGSSQPRDWTWVGFNVSCIAGRFFTITSQRWLLSTLNMISLGKDVLNIRIRYIPNINTDPGLLVQHTANQLLRFQCLQHGKDLSTKQSSNEIREKVSNPSPWSPRTWDIYEIKKHSCLRCGKCGED